VAGKELLMSLYRYKNKWKAEVWVDRKRVASKSGFESRGEAKKWYDTTIASYYEDPAQITRTQQQIAFDDLLLRFTQMHLPTISENTRNRYLIDIDKRIRPHFRYMPLEKVRRLEIELFRGEIMKDLSTRSVNMCMDLLRNILLKGVDWEMVAKTPVRLKPLKEPEVKYTWWDKKEHIVRFLEEAKRHRFYAAFKLALETGMRVGEIVGLSKQDVDLKRCQIHVHRQWIDHLHCYGPTKGRRERFINFDPHSGLKEVLAQAVLMSPDPEVIFVTNEGNRLGSRKLAGRHFGIILRRSGLPKIRFHDLRHTFASWYMIENDDIWSLKGILGHADVQTTQRYAHLSGRHQVVPSFCWNATAKGCHESLRNSRNDGEDASVRGNHGKPSRSFHAPNSIESL
jgi:integrase